MTLIPPSPQTTFQKEPLHLYMQTVSLTIPCLSRPNSTAGYATEISKIKAAFSFFSQFHILLSKITEISNHKIKNQKTK